MSDLISRQAAIDALNEYFARIEKLKRRGLTKGEKAISLDTVGTIKTLPSAQPELAQCLHSACTDTISRQAAIDVVKGIDRSFVKYIEELPSAQTEQKTGKWIPHDCSGRASIDNDACSECGQRFYQIAETGCIWNYCPNCGAEMRGDKDETD